jgi:phosphate uptake regulator
VVRAALARATRGLVTGNATLCGAVVAGDDEVDRQYLDIAEQVWFLVTGELVEFDSAPRVPAPEEQPVRS